MDETKHAESLSKTWIWLLVMLVIILFKGIFAFFVVSDMGQPTWSFRPVHDVPASSPYGVYHLLPHSQHIRGDKGE